MLISENQCSLVVQLKHERLAPTRSRFGFIYESSLFGLCSKLEHRGTKPTEIELCLLGDFVFEFYLPKLIPLINTH